MQTLRKSMSWMNSIATELSRCMNSMKFASTYTFRASSSKSGKHDSVKEFAVESPYKPQRVPARYGYSQSEYSFYKQRFYDGGPLPKIDKQLHHLPKYRVRDAWRQDRAMFGQNDYIDILGDGSVQPYELMQGPMWLKGFRGNEMQRTIRRLKFDGPRLGALEPKKYKDLTKRVRFLFKKLNQRRKRHYPHSKKL